MAEVSVKLKDSLDPKVYFGDVIIYGGVVYLVAQVSKEGLKLICMTTGNRHKDIQFGIGTPLINVIQEHFNKPFSNFRLIKNNNLRITIEEAVN